MRVFDVYFLYLILFQRKFNELELYTVDKT